jgi:hypothetical protein
MPQHAVLRLQHPVVFVGEVEELRFDEQNVCKSSHLMKDEHSSYTPVGKTFASHGFTKHAKKQYVRGNVHSNTA